MRAETVSTQPGQRVTLVGWPREQQVPALRRELPSGVAVSTIALAATAGFLAFAGFESAGSLGEEAHRPGRFIPRAMLAAIALGAVFYVACMLAQSWGFGTDKAGVAAFAGSSAPLGELALDYAGAPMAAVLDLVAVISAVPEGTLRVVPYLVIAWLILGAVRLALPIRPSAVRMSTRPRSA